MAFSSGLTEASFGAPMPTHLALLWPCHTCPSLAFLVSHPREDLSSTVGHRRQAAGFTLSLYLRAQGLAPETFGKYPLPPGMQNPTQTCAVGRMQKSALHSILSLSLTITPEDGALY